jgi:acetyltransferase-like isoleucine patch superfamily enzyme
VGRLGDGSLKRQIARSVLPAGVRRRLLDLPTTVGYFKGPLLASALRKRWVMLRHPRVDIRFGRDTYLGPGFSLHAPFGGTFITGEGVEFRRNFRAELGGPDARIEIGSRSYLTYSVLIQCGASIRIGERCGLAHCTSVYDANHRFRDVTREFMDQGYDVRPITIEDDAQIHGLCTIVNSIGTRAVIGANSVVTRPIPAYTLAVGAPARVVDYFGPPGQDPRDAGPGEGADALGDQPAERAG